MSGGGAVLDVPSGYGRFSEQLAGTGALVFNADLSLEMVRRAIERSGRPGVVADAKRGLPFRDGAFTAVFSMRLFHHLHDATDRPAVLAECARVSSGWAIISYYRTNALHKAQRALRRRLKKKPRKIRLLGRGVFRAEAEAAGWEIIRERPLFRGLHAARIVLLRKSPSPL